MSALEPEPLISPRGVHPDEAVDQRPRPGQMPLVLAGLTIGLVLMAMQLWLLTIALELYLAGHGQQVWQPTLASGLIFAGGLIMLWLLRRRPRRRSPAVQAPERRRV